MTFSVLIPSWRRPDRLESCLWSLDRQTQLPHEVFVVWQKDDTATRDAVEAVARRVRYKLNVLHLPEPGVVPAENFALQHATGAIIALLDDDAIAPPDWLEKHASHYADPTIGAVGGPAVNFKADGTQFPVRAVEPVGRLTWYGKVFGNMYDHVPEWKSRPPRDVDSLVGYNMTLRRAAFDHFEDRLRSYWQEFELEACLQAKARGYRVVFDFSNVIEHHPTNTAYTGGRDGDLQVKIYNSAYNHALILARHSPWYLRPPRLLYMLLVGTVDRPGMLGALVAWRRFGQPGRELRVLRKTWASALAGWRAGRRA